jgi:hypothetical protein
MGVPASEVGYTSTTTGRGDRQVHKGHVVALGKKVKNMVTIKRNRNSKYNQPSTDVQNANSLYCHFEYNLSVELQH